MCYVGNQIRLCKALFQNSIIFSRIPICTMVGCQILCGHAPFHNEREITWKCVIYFCSIQRLVYVNKETLARLHDNTGMPVD